MSQSTPHQTWQVRPCGTSWRSSASCQPRNARNWAGAEARQYLGTAPAMSTKD
eukprot:CAMPEP_0206175952 /NCGR_PEP_ID=MMETSP1474-20131121/56695_1 /ASSEMBLY_ACC=CAM_ASM_001110 /TAXON_ID=97495 /ORGANISM="Imantonia sp., Strain RCC918" /LENGTH=52 /DNA_ID=CAMNT_0053586631 /DNA_START=409 /DNA_END=564 /DNA_ORIENTATION=-